MKGEPMTTFTCPECSWTIKTPFGRQDVEEHTTLHMQKHHRKALRARISKNDLLKLQRK